MPRGTREQVLLLASLAISLDHHSRVVREGVESMRSLGLLTPRDESTLFAQSRDAENVATVLREHVARYPEGYAYDNGQEYVEQLAVLVVQVGQIITQLERRLDARDERTRRTPDVAKA
jgi:hypothetical protein